MPNYQCLNKVKFNDFIMNFDKKLYLNESQDMNLYDNPRIINILHLRKKNIEKILGESRKFYK